MPTLGFLFVSIYLFISVNVGLGKKLNNASLGLLRSNSTQLLLANGISLQCYSGNNTRLPLTPLFERRTVPDLAQPSSYVFQMMHSAGLVLFSSCSYLGLQLYKATWCQSWDACFR